MKVCVGTSDEHIGLRDKVTFKEKEWRLEKDWKASIHFKVLKAQEGRNNGSQKPNKYVRGILSLLEKSLKPFVIWCEAC